jgi:hypothetical protein
MKMRKQKNYTFYCLLLLCCICLQACSPPLPKDQKPGQLCITLTDGTVQCRPVDDHRLLLLRSRADAPQLTTWDAGASLDTARLDGHQPSQALLQVLQKGDSAAQRYTLDPKRTSIRFQDNMVFMTDRQSGKVVRKHALDATQSITFAPATAMLATFDYVVHAEEFCQPMSLLDSLLRATEGKHDVQLSHCGNAIYARMGHVIVAISEFKPILTGKSEDCDSIHEHEGLVPAFDLAGALAALDMPPSGGGEGADEPGTHGTFLAGLPYEGLSIYLCGDRLKLVPADPDYLPYYLDPLRCCYILHRNDGLGLLEIWFSDALSV